MSAIVWIVIRVLALAAALFLLPLGTGYIFLHRGEFDRGIVYFFGMCALFTGFELIYFPFFALGLPFSLMTVVFFVLAAASAALGLFLRSKAEKTPRSPRKPLNRKEKLFLSAAAAVAL